MVELESDENQIIEINIRKRNFNDFQVLDFREFFNGSLWIE